MSPRPFPRRRARRAVRAPHRPLLALTTAGALVAAFLVPGAATAAEEPTATASADQVLTWTANNSVTAYASAPATATAGPATIVFDNSVEAGNTIGMSHTLTFDTTTPGYNHDVSLDILANPWDSSGGVHQAEVVLTPGVYRYFCAIPGHGQMVGELVVTGDPGGEDTTAPTVTAQVSGEQDADGSYVGSARVTLAAADDDSGVASVEQSLDGAGFEPYTGPIVVTEPGEHTVQYRATDNAGNTSTTGSVTFIVTEPDPGDTTPPTVTAQVAGEQDADGAYVGSASVTLTAEDTGTGVATVEYDLDGAGWTAYTAPIVVDEPGMHMIGYRATDNAGNASEAGMVHVVVVEEPVEDTTPPVVTATVTGDLDEQGAYVGRATVTLAAEDTGSGVATVEYDLDGVGYTEYTGPFGVDAPGDHTVRFRATDNAGNASEPGSVTFTIAEPAAEDTTPPTVEAHVTGEQDGDGSYVGSATVLLTAEDAGSGVATVEYDLDGAGYVEYTTPVVLDAVGVHTLTYRATDNAGNMSAPGTVELTVVADDGGDPPDTIAPLVTATVTGDQDEQGGYVGSATVELTAEDEGSGVAAIEYALGDGAFQAYTAPVTVSEPGAHTVRFRATDVAGNTSEVGVVTFLVARDGTDACPASDERPTVVVGSVDSTVPNADVGNGCTINDLVDEGGAYATHGAFVAHVRELADRLVTEDVITAKQRPKLLSAAARSDVGQ